MSLSSLLFLLLTSPGLTVGEGPLVAAVSDVSVPCRFLSASLFNLLNWGGHTQAHAGEQKISEFTTARHEPRRAWRVSAYLFSVLVQFVDLLSLPLHFQQQPLLLPVQLFSLLG